MEELFDLRAVDRLPEDGLRIIHACRKGVEFASFEYVDRKRGEIGYSSPMLDNDTGRASYLLDVSRLKLDETITLAYDEAYARGLDARYVWVALGIQPISASGCRTAPMSFSPALTRITIG